MKRKNLVISGLALALLFVALSYNACILGSSSGAPKVNSTSVGNPFNIPDVAAGLQVTINSNFPSVLSGRTRTVGAAGRDYTTCQAAVDAANPGDVISIDAGFICQPIILRNKGAAPTGATEAVMDIVIESANLAMLPPQGTRISATDEPNMAIVETDGSVPAISTELGASFYYIVGLELRVNADSTLVTPALFGVTSATKAVTDITTLPSNIVVARCWFHGGATQEISRGMDLNGSVISLVDSVVEEIHSMDTGSDKLGQAVAIWDSGAGPFKIDNNELDSTGANFAVGDYPSVIVGLIPSDIQFTHNLVQKNLAWMNATVTTNAGTTGQWTINSLAILGNAQRILIQGNIFQNLGRKANLRRFKFVLQAMVWKTRRSEP